MSKFRVRELKSTDTAALLAFEIENREWFESHIDARDPAFYSLQGVAHHIEHYLLDFARGAWHPLVIEDDSGKIVGRANLKSINSPARSAEVGYRVGQRVCGQGLATLALQQLIHEAQSRWQLTQLVAYVYPENAGSKKVLERCGFLLEQPADHDQTAGECRFVRPIHCRSELARDGR
ncbi:GNAT family N-acetyltransferase [Pseudomonas sp. 14P_8.1_Bac3]|uniref:GNAT family N-acetyltransferase n=1 Tax=Pseudomonas sp. 14P_8.1_Bac3 TaxID=2971621 RepID=UPI0021C64953|nr:GNAT family N-acetyltransferase [Pseudomonas sp. 14P_8.1_Bac3]MCU1763220.1 GNAT family N-acetyltransferase [Pseudomonas sp. 14P_8.1_Bac3]